MSVMIEIEKKYRVLDTHLIKDFLKSTNYLSSGQIIDQYFDTIDGIYYQKGIFIRTRNNISLDIKFNPDHLQGRTGKDHVVCREYNFEIPFQSTSENTFQSLSDLTGIKKPFPYSYENFFLKNELKSLVTIDKIRTTYENKSCIIAVDELHDFGTFIEFEAKDGAQNIQEFIQYVENFTQGLSLQPISSGYVEFALRQTNEPLYRKGKYLLEDSSKSESVLFLSR